MKKGLFCLLAALAAPGSLWACMWATLPLAGIEGQTIASRKYRIIDGKLHQMKPKPGYAVSQGPQLPSWQTPYEDDAPLPWMTNLDYAGPDPSIAKPSTGTVVVNDFFGHLPHYRPLQADPILALLLHQIKSGKCPLDDVEIRHYVASRGWSALSLFDDVAGEVTAKKFIKKHIEPLIRHKKRRNMTFGTWVAEQIHSGERDETDLKRWTRMDGKSLNDLLKISDDSDLSIATRIQASQVLMKKHPRQGIPWAIRTLAIDDEDLAHHASFLLRPYGVPGKAELTKVKEKKAVWFNLAWAAVLSRDEKAMKRVVKLTTPPAGKKIARAGLEAAQGDQNKCNDVVDYLSDIIKDAHFKSLEGKFDIFGPTPPVFLVQCLAVCPEPKLRRRAFKQIFLNDDLKVSEGNRAYNRWQLQVDYQLIQYYAYSVYPHVTRDEQKDFKKWIDEDEGNMQARNQGYRQAAHRIISKLIEKKPR